MVRAPAGSFIPHSATGRTVAASAAAAVPIRADATVRRTASVRRMCMASPMGSLDYDEPMLIVSTGQNLRWHGGQRCDRRGHLLVRELTVLHVVGQIAPVRGEVQQAVATQRGEDDLGLAGLPAA